MQLAKIKKNIKHYAPEILVGVSVAAGTIALIYVIKNVDEIPMVLALDDTLRYIKDTGDSALFETSIGTFMLSPVNY